jgi:hypothetical protein
MPADARSSPPLFVIAASLVAVYCGSALVARPGMVPDAARGFMVWQSMERGAPFNVVREPRATDISRDTESFMTWWTPGQYMVPGALTKAHLDLGRAIFVTTALCVLSGLGGGYVLFSALGFDRRTAAASLCVIAAWRYVSVGFRTYTGGEILLFGFVPWAVWLALRWRRLAAGQAGGLIVLVLAGIFLKSAFVICALAICVSLAAIHRLERPVGPGLAAQWTVVYAGRLAACFLIAGAVYYFAFGRFGSTPAGLFAESQKGISGLLFAVTAPLFAATSISDVLNRLFLYPAAPRVASIDRLWPLFAMGAVAAAACYRLILDRAPGPLYRGVLSGFLVVYVAAFAVLFLFGAAVGTDDRYFRPVAFLLVPGLLHAIALMPAKSLRRVAAGSIVVLSTYGPLSYITHWPAHYREAVGALGFSHDDISAPALSRLRALDDGAPPGSVFYVPSAALALELARVRRISSNAAFEDVATLSSTTYLGRVPHLLIALPSSLGGSRTDAILSSFRDYRRDRWTTESVAEYVFYSQSASSP